jgi:hypothetical protein
MSWLPFEVQGSKPPTNKDFERNFKTRTLHRAGCGTLRSNSRSRKPKKQQVPLRADDRTEKSRQDASATKSKNRSLVAEKLSALGMTA